MTKTSRFGTAFALTLTLAAAMAAPMAHAESEGSLDAATQEKVTAAMTAQGYEVRKVTTEDGKIEVYAVKDGKTYELYLDDQFNIVKTGD